jgi:hypothetical protein
VNANENLSHKVVGALSLSLKGERRKKEKIENEKIRKSLALFLLSDDCLSNNNSNSGNGAHTARL